MPRSLPAFTLALLLALAPRAGAAADGWVSLFDGKSLDGWEANEKPECFQVADGVLKVQGGMAHLFYAGPVQKHNFRNFEFKAEVKTLPGSNSGIFFHTEKGGPGLVRKGYEAQVNNSHEKDPRRTGSLVIVEDRTETPVKDGEWFEYGITVQGKKITLSINGKPVVEYTEPEKPQRPKGREQRVLSSGTFAIQAHDPNSTTYYRNIRVRPLPD